MQENDTPEPSPTLAELDDDLLEDKIRESLAMLEAMEEDGTLLARVPKELRARFLRAAGKVSVASHELLRQFRKEQKRQRRAKKRRADEGLLQKTGIRRAREQPIFATPSRDAPRRLVSGSSETNAERLNEPRTCYVCKASFDNLHPFYDSMCRPCGDLNWAKRNQTADLSGRVALLTGGRVKIGYQAGIKLLRAGCRLLVTTRFPADAARRYAAEEGSEAWLDRLQIYGVDLRHTPSVEAFCQTLLQTESRLDFIINNACQTVRRPPDFYTHLMAAERNPQQSLPAMAQRFLGPSPSLSGKVPARMGESAANSAELSQVALTEEDRGWDLTLFPEGELDADEQQRDLREVNSWRLLMHEVSAVELLEVHLVNAVAPFILNARLKPLMLAVPTPDKHIVNVSAMEGQFYRTFKTAKHPHTNMAKASLNMMTRTSAPDYIRDGIHMNSVDTGWVTDEDPAHHAERKRAVHGFHPPLDIVDGAARICAPIFDGFSTGEHAWGRFLKDYFPTDW